MTHDKRASSQAAWALLTEGTTAARLEAHRLGHMLNRLLVLVEQSSHREHLHQVAGDIIVAFPERLQKLEVHLDRTLLGLAQMGQTFLEARLPLSDKQLVEEAINPAFGGAQLRQSAQRVADAWLERQFAED